MLPDVLPSLILSFLTFHHSKTTIFNKIIPLLIFLLEFYFVPIKATCTMPVFFAQAISSRQVRTMELYSTKEDVSSAAECANLCGQRHFFCQSAIYNHDVHSCALSPNRPVQCSLSKQRFNYFHLKTDGAEALSLIACIQTCQQTTTTLSPNYLTEKLLNKEETRTTIKQVLSPEFSQIHDEEKSELKDTKKRLEANNKQLLFPGDVNALDVLQRLYQMRQRLEQILGEANRGGKDGDQALTSQKEKQPLNDQQKPKDVKPAKTNFYSSKMNKNDTEILIQSGGFVARLKPDEQLKVISTPFGIKQSFNKNKKKQNIVDDLSNTTTFDKRNREESEFYREGEDEEPIIVNGKLIEPATGYLHSVLIHHSGGISSEENDDKTSINDDNKILPSLDVAKLSKSNTGTIICFKFIQHRKLLDYGNDEISIVVKKGLTLNECRCACADTWKLKEATTRCKSLHYEKVEGLCELLSGDHNGKSDLIFNKSSDYHYVSCEGKYLLKTSEKMCSNKSEQLNTTFNNNTTETTNIFIKSEQITNKTFDSDKNIFYKQITQTTTIKAVIDVDNKQQCFERISGFSMNGTAASLEHNISIEHCKCLCANSLHSRYPFQCASVSYFSDERDCVFNLHNRQSAPEQFSPEPDQQVIYLGFICRPKEAINFVENVCNNITPNSTEKNIISSISSLTNQTDSTMTKSPSSTSPPVLSTTHHTTDKEDSSTPLSDACFVEQPGYVLEGMALVARQQISAELCKCICALTEWKFQQQEEKGGNVSNLVVGGCSSSQFYKDSGTCLVSGDNRASAPERFSFDESSKSGVGHSSYLDFRCGADKKALLSYLSNNCQKEMINKNTPATTLANTIETTTKSIEKEDDKQKILKKPKKDKKDKKHKKSEKLSNSSKIKEENKINATSFSTTTIITSTTPKTPLSAEKEEEQLETKTAVPSIESKTSDLDSLLLEGGENWKTIKVEGDKYLNNSEEGGDEKEEEEEDEKIEKRGIAVTSTQNDQPPKEEQNKHENANNFTSIVNVTDTTTATNIIENIIIITTSTPDISNDSTFNNNKTLEEILNINSSTINNLNNTEGMTTTESSSSFSSIGNLFEYPSVGQCHFSALYQTVFNGARLLKRLLVETPAQCLAACHYESCRSANLIQMEDKQKICELFRDSIVEFRRNDVLSFDRLAVHFDSIQCKPREE